MTATFARGLKISMAVILCLSAAMTLNAQGATPSGPRRTSPRLIEKASFDWNHSGKMYTFSLFRQEDANGQTFDRLVIDSNGVRSWSLRSHDGEWASLTEVGLAHLRKQNLVSKSQHFLFVSSGSGRANIYLILKGVDSGCCIGSLTVLTPNERGQPTIVFQSSSHLLAAIDPTGDGDALAMIGQPSDSEARALKNAQSYDPYRVYLLDRDQPAHYDLARSKAYTLAHYCQWHGPKYDEKFVAIGVTTGADHCLVMSDADFGVYRQKHPTLFPEP